MMEHGFLVKKWACCVTLLALVAGASSPLIAAEIRDIRIAPTDTGTRVVLELSGPANYKAFILDNPARVVLDIARSSLKTSLPASEAPLTAVRSGSLPNKGLRLVFVIQGP